MVALFLLGPLVVGYLVVRGVMSNVDRSWNLFIFECSLGITVGFGLTSLLTYCLLVSGNFSRPSQLALEVILACSLIVLCYFTASGRSHAIRENQKPYRLSSVLSSTLNLSFAVALTIGLTIFAVLSFQKPHGGWDAWAIWNLRARFLFHGADHWLDAFSHELLWSHPDYPLLIPSAIARGWAVAGRDLVVVPIVVAALFTFGIIGLMFSSLSLLRDRSQALLGCLILLATPDFVQRGSLQEADLPLAFWFLSFFSALGIAERISTASIFIVIGLAAGFSAWVKNEGALFVLGATICLLLGFRNFNLNWRKLGFYLCGLLPAMLLFLHFKTQFAPASDLFANQTLETMADKILDFERHWTILKVFAIHVGKFGGSLVSFPLVIFLYFRLVGPQPHSLGAQSVRLFTAFLFLMLLGYYFVYLISPYNLSMHMGSSFDRLLLQLWPSVLFVYFRVVRTPQEILAGRESRRNVRVGDSFGA